jgi:Sushi domain (SCR repeat).
VFLGEAFIQEKTTCHSPFIENGQVEGEFNGDMFVGTAKCDPQYELVGKSLIKCQAGIWSAEVPVCTSKYIF